MQKMPFRFWLSLTSIVIGTMGLSQPLASQIDRGRPSCDADNGGLVLPRGFCALLVADEPGRVRHIAVASNGDIFAAVRGRGAEGGLFLLRDTNGDGRADFSKKLHDESGTGVAVTSDAVYFSPDDKVLRFPWRVGGTEPTGPMEVIVHDLPVGGHAAKTVVPGAGGALYVNIGSRTNSCQAADRQARSPGRDPCTELETRAGIWRFDARATGQGPSDGVRVATGLRNAMAISLDPSGRLYAAVHGRDQLSANWGFNDEDNAENPAEEFGPMDLGSDYGWPYCYFDPRAARKVQNPEYGGDGRTVGPCAEKTQPAVAFPAHWAPLSSLFYTGDQFPSGYRGGAFVAFHGSWNRAPLPQAGYRVAYVPFQNGQATGEYQSFLAPGGTATSIRPTGLAMGPDGSLYVSADVPGKIWRIMYVGN